MLKYDVTIRFVVVHDSADIDNAKTSREMAQSIGEFVCDELVCADSPAVFFDIKNASRIVE